MGSISSTQIKPVYTTLIAAKYDELLQTKPTGFLRSMFKDNVTKVRYPMIDVRRGSEKMAVDVMLGHQGIRTQITKSTQKVLDPFYFRYYFDATQLDCYWNLFGSTSISENVMTEFVNGVAQHNQENLDLIDRRYEVLCAEVLEFGTCTSLNDGSIIDFKRKAGSFVDPGAGGYWADAGVDPYAQIGADCEFIRKNGKFTGGVFNLIMGSSAFSDFLGNAVVKGRNDLKMWKLDDLIKPEANIEGQTYHGTISCGPYIVHIWQYPQFYENTSGTLTPYINPKKVALMPVNPTFETIYAATPQLVTPGEATASLQASKYVLSEYIDLKSRTHEFHQESRGVPVPLAVDTLVTRTAVA